MKRHLTRRGFLKTTATAGAGMGLVGLNGPRASAADPAKGAPNAEKLGWRLGIQTWTFRKFSLLEAIDKTASLGLRYIETYMGQRVGTDDPTAQFRANMPANLRLLVKKKLADSGVTLTSHYEVGPSKQMREAGPPRQLIEFCREMGMGMLISEPPVDTMDTFDKLCKEYGIALALTNHRKPATYWNPDTVMEACQGRSKRIGASCDLGHWMHDSLNPMECVKKLEGRILQFHFRDRDKYGHDSRDVPLGGGMANVPGILAEIHCKGIKPLFMLEHDYHQENPLSDLAQSVKFFDAAAATLAAKG